MKNPFRYFKTSPEIIRLAVMMYVRFPLSLRNVEDLLHECGINVSYETVRYWWNRFGPLFASQILRQRVPQFVIDGNGTWTKSSSRFVAKHTICGVPLITKAKYSKRM